MGCQSPRRCASRPNPLRNPTARQSVGEEKFLDREQLMVWGCGWGVLEFELHAVIGEMFLSSYIEMYATIMTLASGTSWCF